MYKNFKIFILVIIICLLITPTIFAESNDYIYLNKLGFNFLKDEEYAKSIICFKKSIKLSNDYTAAYNNLGSAYYRMGKYEKAIKYFNKVINKEKYYVKAYVNLAACYFRQKQYLKAYKYYHKAVNIDKQYVKERLDNKDTKNKLEKMASGNEYEKAMKIYKAEMKELE